MELTPRAAIDGGASQLRSWFKSPRRIAGRSFKGGSIVARVRRATYQQQSTTFGSSGGVFGLASGGHGFVSGGGGRVDTVHNAVVTAVIEDHLGQHGVQELPASLAILEDSLVRLDHVDGRVVAVTNLTGGNGPLLLLGPSAFIEGTTFTRTHGALLLAALVSAGQIRSAYPLAAALLASALAIVPVLRLLRMRAIRRQKEQLGDYIAEIIAC